MADKIWGGLEKGDKEENSLEGFLKPLQMPMRKKSDRLGKGNEGLVPVAVDHFSLIDQPDVNEFRLRTPSLTEKNKPLPWSILSNLFLLSRPSKSSSSA